jgi:hypothetical protein
VTWEPAPPSEVVALLSDALGKTFGEHPWLERR